MSRRCKNGRTVKGTCRKRARQPYLTANGFADSTALSGAKRTCLRFECKPGNGLSPSDVCDEGEVLRCAKYVEVPGRSPKSGQRKGYAQYIYGRALPGRTTVRGKFSPTFEQRKKLPTAEEIKRNRKLA